MHKPQYNKSTLDEYWKIVEQDPEHKFEYIDGYIRMMTGGSVPHGEIALNVGGALRDALRNSECHVYSADVAVQLQEHKCYYPDASVSCDPYDWARVKAIEAPTVVVEVLSPSTENIDKNEKLDTYRHYPTIQEILLIDARRYYVQHHHRIGQIKWEVSIYEHKDDVINLESIEITLPLREIYFKVYLALEEAKLEE